MAHEELMASRRTVTSAASEEEEKKKEPLPKVAVTTVESELATTDEQETAAETETAVVTAVDNVPSKETKKKIDLKMTEDRLAIMAAVAMTELLGSKSPSSIENEGDHTDSQTSTASSATSATSSEIERTSSIDAEETPKKDEKDGTRKRKADDVAVVAVSPETIMDHQNDKKKRQRNGSAESPGNDMGSCDSSPVAMIKTPHYHPYQPRAAPFHRSTSLTYSTPPGVEMHRHLHRHHHPSYRPSMTYSHYSLKAPPPHHPRSSPYGAYSSPAHTPHSRPPMGSPHSRPPPPHTNCYETVTKTSGLPKVLSFRKICSKCGKIRGEHGELGFGNKCVFQECGKCGAGIEAHLKAKSSMGILCNLTVEQGATPGASVAYERKIRELAVRAELQKSMQDDKRERAERLAQMTLSA
jgi:hypothetical protein